jgi:N-acyl-D-aspartate/D-glutamate deacylase
MNMHDQMQIKKNGSAGSFDLMITGGTIYDGTGSGPFTADIGIAGGRITAIGDLSGAVAGETVDATGKLVTPGFIDIHTHMDGQVTWDPLLSPVSSHGVTTIVMGNCGVGFAPVAADRRAWLIDLMEGVEDIPGTALHEGIRWNWETFPEYLDAVEAVPKAIDVAALIPHAPVRTYVMGERGASNAIATPADIAAMADIVREGLQAGALGISVAHTLFLKSASGEYVPGALSFEAELMGIAAPLGELGTGLLQVIHSGSLAREPEITTEHRETWAGAEFSADAEWRWMNSVAKATGRPVLFLVFQTRDNPDQWRRALEFSEAATADGACMRALVHPRSPGVTLTLQNVHPFQNTPTYRILDKLPLPDKVSAMRDPNTKKKILAESKHASQHIKSTSIYSVPMEFVFPLKEPLNYEESFETTPAYVAQQSGRDSLEVFYDRLLEDDGMSYHCLRLVNYLDYNYDAVAQMLRHPMSIFGQSDAGAHCGVMCDAGIPTFMLTHWTRDRRGHRLPLEFAIRKMTQEPAELLEMRDRGVIATGMKADLNVIDYEALELKLPRFIHDLPAHGKRMVQDAVGYVATIVSGQVVMRNGRETGARPGKLVRGNQPRPQA